MDIYRTRDGDMVDAICWRFYDKGQQPLAVERVLEANRGLAARGPLLPAGMEIIMPDLPRPETTPILRIWG